jgi:hypothetical protein
VDGKLDDWAGVLPQTISVHGKNGPTVTEAAWQPYKQFDTSVKTGVATGYLAYDDQYFYFAAKVADSTPDPGMPRFETLNADDYFYPPVAYTKNNEKNNAYSFSIRWTGQVMPKYSETYTFATVSDDGVRLWVNGQPLINNWTDHGPTEDNATIKLVAGQRYDIKMEYYQAAGGAAAHLYWASASQPREIIPGTQLFPSATAKDPAGLTGAYYAGRMLSGKVKLTRVDAGVDFDWAENTIPDPALKSADVEELVWPEGVRRYTYRKDPELPCGNFPNHDNVQIAFNVLPAESKDWYPYPKGTMPGYIGYRDTDYEYALNPVAEKYGGGAEIWRLQYPGMPHKHFYPRQPKSPLDGPVKNGKLVITRTANTRIEECAIPWTEIPEVKKALDHGRTIKFSFRVNDDAGAGCLELARQRSVAKLNNTTFEADWVEHWANEVEFASQH